MRPLDDLQDLGFRCSETLVGVLKQFLRNGEINQRGMNVAVTEIGGQIRQPGLRVDPLLVPLSHPMDDKGVAQIVNAGAGAAAGALQSDHSNQPVEMCPRGDITIAALRMPEQRRVGLGRRACFRAGIEIIAQGGHGGS